jgi:uncharacterized membrane protein YGL010W
MKTLAEQMSVYHRYHTKLATTLTHFIGVPLAIIPVMIILNWLNFGVNGWFHIGMSWLGIIALFLFYLKLDKELGVITTAVLIVLNIISTWIAKGSPNWWSLKWLVIIFVVAWAIQLLGHVFEGKRPALLDNFFQVLIAPIFLVAEVAFMLGKKKKLQAEVLDLAKKG